MAQIPILETDRLTLHAPTLDDLADATAMWADPEIVRHIGGKPFTPEETWSRLLRYVGHWELLGYGMWMARDKAGAFVGEVGLFDLHREMTPALDIPEVGWVLARGTHGRGYATEAVRTVLAWGDAHFGPRAFSCIIDVDNHASHRVAEKCGFHSQGTAIYKGSRVIVYRRG